MRKPKSFTINNFRLGQRRDAALRQDALWSMQTLKNFDIDYGDGRLRVRKGYTRWNDTELPAVADQLFLFKDLAGTERLLAICDAKIYWIKESGAHILIKDGATASESFLQIGNRLFFTTDDGIFWTDATVMESAARCYRLGIEAPVEFPTISKVALMGNMLGLQTTSPPMLTPIVSRKLAGKFTLASSKSISSIMFGWMWGEMQKTGQIRVSVQVDNAGDPGDLADSNAITGWNPIRLHLPAVWAYYPLPLGTTVELPAGDYWVVVEGSEDYYINYNPPPIPSYWVAFPYTVTGGQDAKIWNHTAEVWQTVTAKIGFGLGGLETGQYYEYRLTYYNSAYSIESRPGPKTSRTLIESPTYSAFQINYTAPSDPQADRVRIYRREIGEDPDVAEEAITARFMLVDSVPIVQTSVLDETVTEFLGGELQTEDHYCYDYIDPSSGSAREEAIDPGGMAEWHDRMWLAVAGDLYMSKILEKDGGTGHTNDSTYDFFPLDNKLKMPVPAGILAIEAIADDELVIYFEDENVWVLWGAYESLNPPPDIQRRSALHTGGLIAARGIGKTGDQHIIVTSHGLWSFGGTRAKAEFLSETNQSIFDAIESDKLENSRVLVFGAEIWVLLDTDNDGKLDQILILDMLRDVFTRQLMDRAWRMYQYNVRISDFVVRRRGPNVRHILAADGENKYILKLGTGAKDHTTARVGTIETHKFVARNMVMVSGIEIDSEYPGTPPTYKLYAHGSDGTVKTYNLAPTSQTDIRAHRRGMRLMAVGDANVKVEMTSTELDELKGLVVEFVTE